MVYYGSILTVVFVYGSGAKYKLHNLAKSVSIR